MNRGKMVKNSIVSFVIVSCCVTAIVAEENRSPTVGTSGRIEQIILPGTELLARPLDNDRLPIVVRIVNVFPHGNSFRYDISFYGLEPGKYDLAKYLVRKDGSSTADLPEIPVEVISLLPPGQIEPNDLPNSMISRLGGYTIVLIIATTFWFVMLAGLILLGHKKKKQAAIRERPLTLADLLKPRIQQAINNELDPKQYAELERMLFAFWRKRLNLENMSSAEAIQLIRSDEKAGPLMNQIEQWLHNPDREEQLELASLLEPFQEMIVDQQDQQHFKPASAAPAEAVHP
jgi:hypothetical protein